MHTITLPYTVRDAMGYSRLTDWLGDWCIDERQLPSLVGMISATDLVEHAAQSRHRVRTGALSSDFDTVGDVAVIPLHGVLMKSEASFGGTSTVRARRQLRAAGESESINSILLDIESPGGAVAGNKELADEIAEVARRKRVVAHIQDLGASAAYWLASQASEIYMNEMGSAGSIGTFNVIRDFSKAAEDQGVKVIVVRAGKFKGAGTPGTVVTDEEVAEMQEHIDTMNAFFLDAVARGRKMSMGQVQQIADGRIFIGKAALTHGLIDGIQSFEQTLNSLQSSNQPGRERMSESQTTQSQASNDPPVAQPANPQSASPQPANPQPAAGPLIQSVAQLGSVNTAASIKELRAEFPDADGDFILACAEQELSLGQAKDAYIKHLKTANAQLADKASKASQPGVEGVAASGGATSSPEFDNPRAEWREKIAAKVKEGVPRDKAILAVDRENPGLREAMVAAAN